MESTLVSKHRDDLKSSGLSDNTITLSNIYSASIEEVVKLGFSHRSPAMAIPYHDGSVRLKPDIPFINKKGKPAKYLTLKDGKIILYIPPNFNKSNLQDSSIPLVITEGEKKTLKSNQEGIPTVGLSGVWNFASDGVTIPDLMNIKWCGRLVYICFDSDAVLKWEILMAEWTLGRWLESKDATVRIIRLPSILGSAKTGLDDYLIKRTKKDFEQLQQESKGIDFFFQKPNEVLRALLDGIKYEIYSYEKEKDGVRATLSILDLKTGNPIFKDSLPLWSAKKRTEFANKNKELGYADVDKHLTVIEEQLKIFTPIDKTKVKETETISELLNTKTSLFDIHAALSETMSSPWIHDAIEIVLAVSINMPLIEKDRNNGLLWVLLIGNPSSYKTEAVGHLSDTPHCYFLDSITSNSFASGYINTDGKKAKDLLPELAGKFFIIKDYTTLFSSNEESIKKVLGDLQSIYDGDYSKYTGTAGNITYKNVKFSHVGCITPLVVSKQHSYMSMLGSRFLFYRLPELVESEVAEGCRIICEETQNQNRQETLRKKCSAYSYQLYNEIPNIEMQTESPEHINQIVTLGKLLARGRGVITGGVSEYYDTSDTAKTKPRQSYSMKEKQVEEPFRALRQLLALGKGLALVHGRQSITDHEIEILRRVVVSSMPVDRSKVLTLLIKEKRITRRSCSVSLSKSYGTAVQILEELRHLNILKKHISEESDEYKENELIYEVVDEFREVLLNPIEPIDHLYNLEKDNLT